MSIQNLLTKETQYWLMKSEPDVFSLDHLKAKKTQIWDGVRNYMARNYMMKGMKLNDLVLFYHSNAEPSGVVGIAKVTELAKPDPTQFDKKSDYYDEKSTKQNPRWHCVEVGYVSHFKNFISLKEIQAEPFLKNMVLLKNSRLSVQPVTKAEFDFINSWGMGKSIKLKTSEFNSDKGI
jgi:predicted RNA-binding protein with PUA-like domain